MLAAYLSVLVKALVLAMCLVVFWTLRNDHTALLGPFTHFYLLKRRYELLKGSILAVAGLLLLEIIDSIASIAMPGVKQDGLNLLLSDIVAIVLSLMLIRLYKTLRATPA